MAMGTFACQLDPVTLAACPLCMEEVKRMAPCYSHSLLPSVPSLGTGLRLFAGLGLLQDCVYLLCPVPGGQGEHNLPDQLSGGLGQGGNYEMPQKLAGRGLIQ